MRKPSAGERRRYRFGAASRLGNEHVASIVSLGFSVENEAGLAVIRYPRIRLAGAAIDAVEFPKQYRCGIACIGISIVGTRQILLPDCAHHGGRDPDHE